MRFRNLGLTKLCLEKPTDSKYGILSARDLGIVTAAGAHLGEDEP